MLNGLTCAHCASVIDEKVKHIDGVKNSNLNFTNKKLSVEIDCDNEEKIIKTFAKLKYSLYEFESEDITYENEYFLNQLKLNYDILLDNSFFDELKEDSKIKLVEYKNRSKNRKSISIILVIIGIILLISIVVSSTIENKNTRKKNEKIISEYCESNEYKYVSLDKIVSNYKCSDYVYYLLNKKISNEDIGKIIESNNVEMYQKYYDVFKENLHSSYYKDYEVEETEDGIDIMDVESTITNITYLDYLYNNKSLANVDDLVSFVF